MEMDLFEHGAFQDDPILAWNLRTVRDHIFCTTKLWSWNWKRICWKGQDNHYDYSMSNDALAK